MSEVVSSQTKLTDKENQVPDENFSANQSKGKSLKDHKMSKDGLDVKQVV